MDPQERGPEMAGSDVSHDAGAAYESAIERRDWSTASALAAQQPDPEAAFRRVWNLAALGEDSTEEFTIERMAASTARAAERIRDAIWADHLGKKSCDDIAPYEKDIAVGANRLDGRDLPWLAYHLVTYEALTDEMAARLLARAWKSAEYPETLGTDAWKVMFAFVPEIVTDVDPTVWRAEQEEAGADPRDLVPTEPLRLYRGATASRQSGMAWTDDLDRAEWFARRWNGHLDDTAVVWTAQVEPERILARFVSRGEDEFVVDTEGMTIEPLGDGEQDA